MCRIIFFFGIAEATYHREKQVHHFHGKRFKCNVLVVNHEYMNTYEHFEVLILRSRVGRGRKDNRNPSRSSACIAMYCPAALLFCDATMPCRIPLVGGSDRSERHLPRLVLHCKIRWIMLFASSQPSRCTNIFPYMTFASLQIQTKPWPWEILRITPTTTYTTNTNTRFEGVLRNFNRLVGPNSEHQTGTKTKTRDDQQLKKEKRLHRLPVVPRPYSY